MKQHKDKNFTEIILFKIPELRIFLISTNAFPAIILAIFTKFSAYFSSGLNFMWPKMTKVANPSVKLSATLSP